MVKFFNITEFKKKKKKEKKKKKNIFEFINHDKVFSQQEHLQISPTSLAK